MANRFSEVLAGLPQVSRKTFWRLRESRKCLEKLFGVCGSPASVSRNFLAFAGVPQVSRKTFWCLRESRKCLEKLFGVCGKSANVFRFPIRYKTTTPDEVDPHRESVLNNQYSYIWYRWYGVIRSGNTSSPAPAFPRSYLRDRHGVSCPCSYADWPRCRRSCPG